MCGLLPFGIPVFQSGTGPLLSLLGCAICGFSVGIMRPGALSLSSQRFPSGGTALFALLAMAGDLGGSIGPGIVGQISQAAGDNIRAGLRVGLIFPVVLLVILFILESQGKKSKKESRLQ